MTIYVTLFDNAGLCYCIVASFSNLSLFMKSN